jgi:starch synthase
MGARMNVLFLAAEAEPFIKVGGLGDVAGSLPRAIRALSADPASDMTSDVRLVLPFHQVIRAGRLDLRPQQVFAVEHEGGTTPVRVFETELGGMPVYLLDSPPISGSGSVYASDSKKDGEKFALFSMAALELPRVLDWPVDILHANDWHTALAVYALHVRRQDGVGQGAASVLTIHNLPFMGPALPSTLPAYGLRRVQTGLPAWAGDRPLPLGLWAADAIVAVSPSYAREIQTKKSGGGLHDYIRARSHSLHGILNGIDVEDFNPATDSALESNYGLPTLDRRGANKLAIQARFGLPQDPRALSFGVVSRLDPQKGTDLIPAAFQRIRDLNWQLIVLGTGQPRLEESLRRLHQEFPNRVRVEIAFDARLARQIYAGCDALLMPSRYEPCGLAQMIAMRYGCVPVVSAVGGLLDTVIDGVTGVVMGAPTAARLGASIRKTLDLYVDEKAWTRMQQAAMSQDFSWNASARKYFELYRGLTESSRLGDTG